MLRFGFLATLSVVLTCGASTAWAGRSPAEAVKNLDVAPGLEATLLAAEPMLLSPSNIDVDHRGRIWVCEVVNYRQRAGTRPEGDRILILEDSDHDGRVDKQTVFYQGRDIDSALGICVLGDRVIVSCAPNVFVFRDRDGDGRADEKELLFAKVGQPQHDHSTHAFVFGPDGRLYWNVGNTGQSVSDKRGQQIVDLAGNPVVADGHPYRQGMAFRCEPDGSKFEVIAYNFRNNYELAVDSFGTVWQSDNDDDGNRSVRINYVMEYGNFGYTDDMTGAGWKTPRTNLEEEIPARHWHQNDPGVVPNLLVTGGGSPTGICLYEGSLLPQPFRNQMIHCDAGPNVCRAYPVEKRGAGYRAEIRSILDGTRDNWFRPSDVAVAPDGSLVVADWYDPGVGGHRMGDVEQGRLFRVAPPGSHYTVPRYDYRTAAGAAGALASPNLDARYRAWTALRSMGSAAEPALVELYANENPRLRARALWLLARLESTGRRHVETALADANPDLRITALRAARQCGYDVVAYVSKLVHDPAPEVRRECAIALRHEDSKMAAGLWADLAAAHEAGDRWYLEALGIGADGRWEARFAAWLRKVGSNWNTPAGRDIVWRSRASGTPEYLARIITDPTTPSPELPRYLRAFDFLPATPAKQQALEGLAMLDDPSQVASKPHRSGGSFVIVEALNRLPAGDERMQQRAGKALAQVLAECAGTSQFVSLVDRFNVRDEYGALLALAGSKPDEQLGVEAIRVLLAKKEGRRINQALANGDEARVVGLVRVLGNAADGRGQHLLVSTLENAKAPAAARQEAVRALAKTRRGAEEVVKLASAKQLGAELEPVAAFALHSSTFDEVKREADKLFPLPPSKNDEPLPPIAELVKSRGNAQRGKDLFRGTATCSKCHIVAGDGKEVGPNLSEIGSKLSRDAMFEAILYPSAGISHNYETHLLLLADGNTVQGIITSETPSEIAVKSADSIVRTYRRDEIEQLEKLKISLMPADLQRIMTAGELVDVVEYMTTLKKKS